MRRSLLAVLLVAVLGLGGYYAFAVALQPVASPAGTAENVPDAGTEAGEGPGVAGVPADATAAVVEYVHDGDTLFLTDGRKVRLLGINTPEIGDNAECYGEESTAIARNLLPEGSVVSVLGDIEPLDQYGRSLLFIYAADGTNINIELLRVGAAQVEMYEPNLLFRDAIEAAEREAQATGVGIWGEC